MDSGEVGVHDLMASSKYNWSASELIGNDFMGRKPILVYSFTAGIRDWLLEV